MLPSSRFNRGEWLVAACLAAMLSSCQVRSLDATVFRCTSDQQCGAGMQCLEGLCRSASTTLTGLCASNCSATRTLCCGTTCVDPATDSRHCGACGHVCELGTACAGGTCVPELCANGLDDNQDGLTDCQDGISCPTGKACRGGVCCQGSCASEATAALCSDGLDNDCDGLVDCADSECLGQTCGAGKACLAPGTCAAGCFIEGQARLPNTADPDAPCFACVPGTSTVSWSPVARGASSSSCSGSRRCDGNGGCRAANGQPCGGETDCASGSCAEGVCVTP